MPLDLWAPLERKENQVRMEKLELQDLQVLQADEVYLECPEFLDQRATEAFLDWTELREKWADLDPREKTEPPVLSVPKDL